LLSAWTTDRRSSIFSPASAWILSAHGARPPFFQALLRIAPCLADEMIYVGDRLDNDLKPAKAAGLRTAFIRRGPWGYIQERHPEITEADWKIGTLAELPKIVAAVNSSPRRPCS
jgi:FMN phosphatase YigB (HAD superfamily)